MSIRFRCENCGHPIDVDDRLEGAHGHCKHCGRPLVVPEHEPGPHDVAGPDPEAPGAPLRLRPIEGEPPGVSDHLLGPQAPLSVRPAGVEPAIQVEAISAPDAPPRSSRRRRWFGPRDIPDDDYGVLDPFGVGKARPYSGPPPLWKLFPTLTARFLANRFRTLRDWLYLASVFSLVVVLFGYLFQWKLLLHLGAVAVVAANIGLLFAGIAYLVTLPFKESLPHGLANLLVPFYAFYYWSTRWPRMKTPVYKTLGSFLPIALVALAYAIYEEAPVVEKAIEEKLPALEERVDRLETRTDEALRPLVNEVPALGKGAGDASPTTGPDDGPAEGAPTDARPGRRAP